MLWLLLDMCVTTLNFYGSVCGCRLISYHVARGTTHNTCIPVSGSVCAVGCMVDSFLILLLDLDLPLGL